MQWFRDLNLSSKLKVAFGGIILSSLLLALFQGSQMYRLSQRNSELGLNTLPSVQTSQDLRYQMVDVRRNTLRHILEKRELESKKVEADLDASAKRVDSLLERYKELVSSEREGSLRDALEATWKGFHATTDEVIGYSRSNEDEKALELTLGRSLSAYLLLQSQIDSLVHINLRAADENVAAGARSWGWAWKGSMIVLALQLGLAFLLARMIHSTLAKPVAQVAELAEQVGGGDLTRQLHLEQRDELGLLASTFTRMAQGLASAFVRIRNSVTEFQSIAGSMREASRTLRENADTTARRSDSVSAASEEMSTQMQSVAAAARQSSGSISSVAAAMEEMAASIAEIARGTENARQVTQKAVHNVETATSKVDGLADASRLISSVIQTIADIAEQTKLLALNATIEAARAGEAGKGFAVVAGEVKQLAKGAAEATEDIRHRIEQMQSSTQETVSEIESIRKVIAEVEGFVQNIAGAVEEQSVSTREISGSVAQASAGIQEVAHGVGEAASVSRDISREIQLVRQASLATNEAAIGIAASAERTEALAEEQRDQVSRFRLP